MAGIKTSTQTVLDFGDRTAAIKAVKEGIPLDVYTNLKTGMNVPDRLLAQTINLPERTLLRRKHEGRFKPEESEKIIRLVRLFDLAKKVLGSEEEAGGWFQEKCLALGFLTPLEYADTELGAQEVEELLYRIEYTMLS
jgi:putative toxin-antitoxin system antitoxin component (TIGR02293 family)